MIKIRWPWQWGVTNPDRVRDQLACSEQRLAEARVLGERADKVEGWLRHHMRNNDFAAMIDEEVFGRKKA